MRDIIFLKPQLICEVAVTLTFDLEPLKSSQFILHSSNVCAKFMNIPRRCSWDVDRRHGDRRTWKHYASSSECRRRWAIISCVPFNVNKCAYMDVICWRHSRLSALHGHLFSSCQGHVQQQGSCCVFQPTNTDTMQQHTGRTQQTPAHLVADQMLLWEFFYVCVCISELKRDCVWLSAGDLWPRWLSEVQWCCTGGLED